MNRRRHLVGDFLFTIAEHILSYCEKETDLILIESLV